MVWLVFSLELLNIDWLSDNHSYYLIWSSTHFQECRNILGVEIVLSLLRHRIISLGANVTLTDHAHKSVCRPYQPRPQPSSKNLHSKRRWRKCTTSRPRGSTLVATFTETSQEQRVDSPTSAIPPTAQWVETRATLNRCWDCVLTRTSIWTFSAYPTWALFTSQQYPERDPKRNTRSREDTVLPNQTHR